MSGRSRTDKVAHYNNRQCYLEFIMRSFNLVAFIKSHGCTNLSQCKSRETVNGLYITWKHTNTCFKLEDSFTYHSFLCSHLSSAPPMPWISVTTIQMTTSSIPAVVVNIPSWIVRLFSKSGCEWFQSCRRGVIKFISWKKPQEPNSLLQHYWPTSRGTRSWFLTVMERCVHGLALKLICGRWTQVLVL